MVESNATIVGQALCIFLNHLPEPSYSANRSRGQHWIRQYEDSLDTKDEIVVLVRSAGWQKAPLVKARVVIAFGLPDKRRRDHDGLVQRMKPYFDALITAGVLSDDSLDVIGWPEYRSALSPKEPYTLIQVDERTWRRLA